MQSWKWMKQTMFVLINSLIASQPDEVYNMSTDIFVVDTPWLIERLEEEAKKEHPEKLRYVLRDLAAKKGFCLRIHRLPSKYSFCRVLLQS